MLVGSINVPQSQTSNINKLLVTRVVAVELNLHTYTTTIPSTPTTAIPFPPLYYQDQKNSHMATAEEDFTFPATATDSPPCFIESPPLWRRSSSSREKTEKLKGKEVADAGKFKLGAYQEFKASSSSSNRNWSLNLMGLYEDEDEEEKMDMLWEDLNDEYSGKRAAHNTDISSPGSDVQISCVQALKLSKANGHMLSGKKLSILVFIKILKKAFLLHSSRRAINKQTW